MEPAEAMEEVAQLLHTHTGLSVHELRYSSSDMHWSFIKTMIPQCT
jgi:hypothetical protein